MTRVKQYDMLIPLFIILTLIATVNSVQAYFVFVKGEHYLINFLPYVLSKMIFMWYFALLSIVVRQLSTLIPLRSGHILIWIIVHTTVLFASLIVHHGFTFVIDKILLGPRASATFYAQLFNNPSVWLDFVMYLLFLLGFYMIEYKKENEENEIKVSRLEVELITSKLYEMRNRIHPKFLFNTLDVITELLSNKKNKEANRVLTLLSEFLRTTVYGNDSEEVFLEEEIIFLSKYLLIEEKNFDNNFIVHQNIEPETVAAKVPNFLIQPIVEELISKIIKPNIANYELFVNIQTIRNSLEIITGIKGEDLDESAEQIIRDGAVYKLTGERIAKLYTHSSSLNLKYLKGEGVFIKILLPLKKFEEQHEVELVMEPGIEY
jgi:sensor histidine kinase YesM